MLDLMGVSRFIETCRLIKESSEDGMCVVEIGSNDASFRSYFPNLSWKTVDKYGNPDIKADLDGPGCKLPFDDDSIDLVICTEVLEHLVQGSFLVNEISRVLRPDGRAIISVPNMVSLKCRLRFLMGMIPHMAASGDCGEPLGGTGKLIDGSWVGGHVVDFNEKRLVKYLARAGLATKSYGYVGIEFRRSFFGLKISIPKIFISRRFSDFVIVSAGK